MTKSPPLLITVSVIVNQHIFRRLEVTHHNLRIRKLEKRTCY